MKEIRELLLEWSYSLPMSLIMTFAGFFANSLKVDIRTIDDWNEYKRDLNSYIKFMEALHYFCSRVRDMEQAKYIQKIKDCFEQLSIKKKKQGLGDIIEHAKGLEKHRADILIGICQSLDGSLSRFG